jgi:hypothetical protein
MEFLLASNDTMSLKDVEEIERDVGTMDGSTDTIARAAPALIPFIQTAYANLQAASDPLVDPAHASDAGAGRADPRRLERVPADTSQIFVNGHYNPPTSRRAGSPACRSSSSGGTPQAEPVGRRQLGRRRFVGTVDFSDASIDGNDYSARRRTTCCSTSCAARRPACRSTTRATTSAAIATRSSSRA